MAYIGARSYEDGIEFRNYTTGTTVKVLRNNSGEMDISNGRKVIKLEKKWKLPLFFASILYSILFSLCSTICTKVLVTMLLAWIVVFAYYVSDYMKNKNNKTFCYHAAEHRILNYYYKTGHCANSIEELKNIPSICLSCGSTIIAIVMILISLQALVVTFIPILWLKIILFLASFPVVLYLWGNDKCNFLQEMVLKEPGQDELEVALCGLNELLKHN